MKKYKLGLFSIVGVFVFLGIFTACKDDMYPSDVRNGYIEYQFKDTLKFNGVVQKNADGSPKFSTGLKRVQLTHASFATHQLSSLPDSLSRFRQIEILFFSDDASFGQSSYPKGSSVCQLSLIDSTKFSPDTIRSKRYTTRTLAVFSKLSPKQKGASCVNFSMLINKKDTQQNDPASFNTFMTGQDGVEISVVNMRENNIYEIVSGTAKFGDFSYRFYYRGVIENKGKTYTP
jgi:hypothetical protein